MVEIDIHEQSVVESLRTLEARGISFDMLLQCTDEDIKDFVPTLISILDAFKLKLALRKERARVRGALTEKEAYQHYLQFLGRIDVHFEDQSSDIQFGNCILIANPGVAITALHVLQREEERKCEDDEERETAGRKSKKRQKILKITKVRVPIREIQVTFPNTQGGVLSYHAKVMATSSTIDDVALISPLDEHLPFPARFQSLLTLQRWLPYKPEVNDRVLLLSFPSSKGGNWFSHSPTDKDDLPSFAKGSVSCFNARHGHGLASYVSFEGASGGLILHLDKDGRAKPMIHLGTYHESQEIPIWALPLLNDSLSQKGCNGYFTTNAGIFFEACFGPRPDPIIQNMHPQVGRAKAVAVNDITSPHVFTCNSTRSRRSIRCRAANARLANHESFDQADSGKISSLETFGRSAGLDMSENVPALRSPVAKLNRSMFDQATNSSYNGTTGSNSDHSSQS